MFTTDRKLISPRQGARRLDIPVNDIYRAKKRGTIMPAEGDGVPEGVWFDEAEFERWAANRERLREQGRPRGAVP